MPWNNQSGGGGRNGGGPWGSPPPGGGGGGGGQSPDLEEILRRSQDRLKNILPGGGGGGASSGGGIGPRGLMLVVFVAVAVWLASGIYRVEPDEQGVVLRFGEYTEWTGPGLHYHLPFPIEQVLTPKVTRVNRIDIGLISGDENRRSGSVRDVPEESLMLTGDENIVDVDFSVFWVIKEAGEFLFNIQNPESTVKAVAESAMREVVGTSDIQPILTEARQKTELVVQELIQNTLDNYGAGIQITQVQMQKVDPPTAVIDSFRDVQAARADQERAQNEAQTYANRVVPEARGEAERIIQAAEAYRERTIAEAKGQTDRFNKVYEEYRKAPEVTRERMFLETMERVFGGMDKVIIDSGEEGGTGVVPYLPLDQLQRSNRGGNQ